MAHTRNRGTCHVRSDVTQQQKRCCKWCSLWVHFKAIWLHQPSSVQLVSAVQLSTVKWSEFVERSVKGMVQFSHCELLPLEAGSWGTGIVWEPRVRETSAIGSRYQKTYGEDTADWKDLVHAAVNCRGCELVIVLQLLAVTICKWSINPITNPNTVYSYTHVRDNIIVLNVHAPTEDKIVWRTVSMRN
jgi:hypothetical protein